MYNNILRSKLAIILLAAGEGLRLGSYPKALLEINGVPLIQRFWNEVLPLYPIECITVLGFYAERIKNLAAQYSNVIIHPNPKLGQASSVRLGLEALRSDFEYLIVALVDQPTVGINELNLLINYAITLENTIDAVVPCYREQRGNPVLFKRKAIDEILNTPDQSCRTWLDQNQNRVAFLETSLDSYVRDVDDFNDLKREGVHQPL